MHEEKAVEINDGVAYYVARVVRQPFNKTRYGELFVNKMTTNLFAIYKTNPFY